MFGNQQPLYGNPYPTRYPQAQPLPQSYYQPMAQAPQPCSLIQVTGMEGAKAFPLAPASTAALFDADRDVMYIKRTDSGGYPTIQAYQFTPLQEAAQAPSPEYVTRAEFEKLKEAIFNGIQSVPRTEPESNA